MSPEGLHERDAPMLVIHCVEFEVGRDDRPQIVAEREVYRRAVVQRL